MSETDGVISWRCTTKGCTAAVETNENLHGRISKDSHSHPPRSDEFFMSQEIKNGIKRRLSSDPSERPQKTINLVIKDIPTEKLNNTLLKQYTGVAKRKKRSKKPLLPKASEIDEAWQTILAQDKFVQIGDFVQDARKGVVMLGSKESIQLLSEHAEQIFGDGTFKYAPKHYKQMYTIHIHKDNIYVPVIYFLLKNKQTKTCVQCSVC